MAVVIVCDVLQAIPTFSSVSVAFLWFCFLAWVENENEKFVYHWISEKFSVVACLDGLITSWRVYEVYDIT